jgi:ferric-dicitrate binding protein FerR (iron transport regulator)
MFVRTGGPGRSCACGLLLAAVLTCALPAWAQLAGPRPAGSAEVTFVDGQVSYLRDSVPWVLSVGDFVKPGQLIVTGPNSGAKFKLTDGSEFEVFANSQVEFRDNLGDWRDLLNVWLGKIRVHIQRLGGAPNPNRVHTPTALISVRGTTFEVRVDSDGSTTFVLVVEGMVDVQDRTPSRNKVSLTDGESVIIYKNVPLARSVVDKGALARQVARGMMQGVEEIFLNRSRGGSGGASVPAGGGSAGTGSVGDTKAPTPPPPPPPPPPPH